jgi:hypothetical protein
MKAASLVDYLASEVHRVITANRHSLSAHGILDVMPVRPFGQMDSGESHIIRGMGEFEVKYFQV